MAKLAAIVDQFHHRLQEANIVNLTNLLGLNSFWFEGSERLLDHDAPPCSRTAASGDVAARRAGDAEGVVVAGVAPRRHFSPIQSRGDASDPV
ncbi:MAG TPA: hypothetical protein VGO22_03890 [Pseudorhizobium sp.]|jgi:hypothetical protein|nr:hypothetical protein [Pseudorhizobium sp.]